MAFSLNNRTGRARYRPLAEINVTPLVDVMLVLLIIFMVTAPLMTSGVSVDLPKANAKQLNIDSEPLTVSIKADGTIFLQNQKIDLADLVVQAAGDRPEQCRASHLCPRRQGPRLWPHHAGDGHDNAGRVHQGRVAGGAARRRSRGRQGSSKPAAPAPQTSAKPKAG